MHTILWHNATVAFITQVSGLYCQSRTQSGPRYSSALGLGHPNFAMDQWRAHVTTTSYVCVPVRAGVGSEILKVFIDGWVLIAHHWERERERERERELNKQTKPTWDSDVTAGEWLAEWGWRHTGRADSSSSRCVCNWLWVCVTCNDSNITAARYDVMIMWRVTWLSDVTVTCWRHIFVIVVAGWFLCKHSALDVLFLT